MTTPERCSEAQLRSAAEPQSLETLQQALIGWAGGEFVKNDTS